MRCHICTAPGEDWDLSPFNMLSIFSVVQGVMHTHEHDHQSLQWYYVPFLGLPFRYLSLTQKLWKKDLKNLVCNSAYTVFVVGGHD